MMIKVEFSWKDVVRGLRASMVDQFKAVPAVESIELESDGDPYAAFSERDTMVVTFDTDADTGTDPHA